MTDNASSESTISGSTIPESEAMGFSTPAEDFDLDTGERVWDTMLMTEFGGTDAAVLGIGSAYVYIRSAKGLLILDAGTGDFEVFQAEIIHSPQRGAIMLRPEDGTMQEIVLAKHGWFGLPW